MEVKIVFKGMQKTSLIDYPDHISTVLFTGNCNFKCGYCYNQELIKNFQNIPSANTDIVLDYLQSREKYIDGVVITGGEPTICEGVIPFMREVKKIGLDIKLDTNGGKPEVIKEMIDENLLDYIAMDIKSDLMDYELIANCDIEVEKIANSISLIQNSGILHEFRTTVWEKHPIFENYQILLDLKAGTRYFMQNIYHDGRIDVSRRTMSKRCIIEWITKIKHLKVGLRNFDNY